MYCRSFEKKYLPEYEIPARVLRMQENLVVRRTATETQMSELKEMFENGMSKHDIAKAMSK